MIYIVNVIILILYGFALLLAQRFELLWLQQVIGVLFFLLPGLNLVWLLRTGLRLKVGWGDIALLTLAMSTIILPLVAYTSLTLGHRLTEERMQLLALETTLILLLLGLAIEALRVYWASERPRPSLDRWSVRHLSQTIQETLSQSWQKIKVHKLVWIALLVYGVVMVLNFWLYPFIPEADGYHFLSLIDRGLATAGKGLDLTHRPLFPLLGMLFFSLTHIPLSIFFKYLIPLALGTNILVLYQFLQREKGALKRADSILLLLPLSFPVLVMEFLYPRSQSVILLLLPIILYLSYFALKTRTSWGLYVALILGAVSIKHHELGFLTILIPFFSGIVFYWSFIKTHPLVTTGLVIYGIIGALPYWETSSPLVTNTWQQLIETVRTGDFRWWFVSHYRTIDGVELGWPGYSWLLYYGYNLGLVLPLIIVLYPWRQRRLRWAKSAPYFPFVLAAILFFIVAEVLPRVNYNFYPERAWIFFDLALIPLLSLALYRIIQVRKWYTLVVVVMAISIGVSFYVTYRKQGWVSSKEYEAAQFLKANTEPGSIIISQPANGPFISYYGDRGLLSRDIFTKDLSSEAIYSQVQGLALSEESKQSLLDKSQHIEETLRDPIIPPPSWGVKEVISYEDDRKVKTLELLDIRKLIAEIDKNGGVIPVYIVYSHDKFESLYGERSWWRSFNYSGADLAPLNDGRYFERIFFNDAVSIWKPKQHN